MIARELANAAVQDVGWMLKPLVAQWVENPDVLTAAEASDINLLRELMLRQAGGEPVRLQYGCYRNPRCCANVWRRSG